MPDCEFKEACDTDNVCNGDSTDCYYHGLISRYFNSPQFRNEFVRREELVKEIERRVRFEFDCDIDVVRDEIIDIIRSLDKKRED